MHELSEMSDKECANIVSKVAKELNKAEKTLDDEEYANVLVMPIMRTKQAFVAEVRQNLVNWTSEYGTGYQAKVYAFFTNRLPMEENPLRNDRVNRLILSNLGLQILKQREFMDKFLSANLKTKCGICQDFVEIFLRTGSNSNTEEVMKPRRLTESRTPRYDKRKSYGDRRGFSRSEYRPDYRTQEPRPSTSTARNNFV